MEARTILLALLRVSLCGEALPARVREGLTPALTEEVYRLAKHHDLAHLAADALGKCGLLGKDALSEKLKEQQFLAVLRYERIRYELGRVCALFEEGGIPHIPLKGSVLRKYYPEEWMRTSCDIDIWVPKDRLAEAEELLTEKLGYEKGEEGAHDISYRASSGVHLELHFTLVEEGRVQAAAGILEEICANAPLCPQKQNERMLSDEAFYFYHVAHMAKHFENGGCGVRPFLDLWFLEHRVPHDNGARDLLLEKGGLLSFARGARSLAEVWCGGKEKTEADARLEDFIFKGGVYGTRQNRVEAGQARKGGRARFLLGRIFLPYRLLRLRYPSLEKHKWLLPFYEVRRWFAILFRGGAANTAAELSVSVDGERKEALQTLFQELGLN